MRINNVLKWLERSAERYPDRCAFTDTEESVTFSELMYRARRAGTFIAKRIKPRGAVAFYMEKSVTAVCCMLGAVYAGCFYSFLDTKMPDTRAMSIIGTLGTELIITEPPEYENAERIKGGADIVRAGELLAAEPDAGLLERIRARTADTDPLYVNFTSGSTGVPKGVTVCHRSVIDFIGCFTELFGITKDDILGNQAPFDFDVSVKDIYSGLCAGAAVHIIPREYFTNPVKLMDYIADGNVTVLIWAVSAMCFVSVMNGFMHRVPDKVRKVMFSGEILPIKHYNKWKKYLPDAEYVNLYGPTEITCNCTYHIIKDGEEYAADGKIPIGIPFPNERVFLLGDGDRMVSAPGEEGEICVAGTALALGYYGMPEKTAEVFTQNPLNSKYPETIYRTGDIGTYNEDGELVYLSRKDHQIKHLGHRIELAEIELAACALDGVEEACCLYHDKKSRLILFYSGTLTGAELTEALRDRLPQFMIPNKAVQLDKLPMTKNGKTDRNALKEKEGIS